MDCRVKKYASLLWLAGVLLGACTPAWAASFDCKKAVTLVEQTLCANAELSRLDTTLGEHYRRAMDKLEGAPREALRNGQRAWLQTRNACGRDVTCLQPLLSQRVVEVGTLTQPDTAELDAIIASIPDRPADAAKGLRGYPTSELAAAWLVYLQRFEPTSGVTAEEADANRQQVLAVLKTDSFPWGIYQDLENDTKVSRDQVMLTLLRMMIERAQYVFFGDQRAYVHCFVFSRHGADAYAAFGPLYGSTRDTFAPVCAPQGDLFKQTPWKQLDAAFDPAISTASGNTGTIRFASYAAWNVLGLRATVSPRDFLTPAAPAQDPAAAISSWTDDALWPKKSRQQALAAIEPARQLTATWLQRERGLSADDARRAAREIVRQWLDQRLDFIGDYDGSE